MTATITGSTRVLTSPVLVARGDPLTVEVRRATYPSAEEATLDISTNAEPTAAAIKFGLR